MLTGKVTGTSRNKLPELLPNSLSGWVINKIPQQRSFRLSILLTFVSPSNSNLKK